jgi:ornithine cyclodeaminase/alanine dehydrogenase-like protein (mu-crystallin family)
MRLLLLDAEAIRAACPMSAAIDAVAVGFTALSADRAQAPVRIGLPLSSIGGSMLLMPARADGFEVSSVKVVSVAPENRARGLATVQAIVVLVDSATGVPVAILEGATLTALRTGAAGGLAARMFAPEDCEVIALYGAGVQARAQLEGLLAVRAPREVRVATRSPEHAKAFVSRFEAPPGVRLRCAGRDAARGADVVICATTSHAPVFDAADLGARALLIGVGSFQPDACEFEPAVFRDARVIVDQRSGAVAESGELIVALRDGIIRMADVVEIGECTLAGPADPRRTVFKSVGNAVQDLAVGSQVVQRAQQQGLGRYVDL